MARSTSASAVRNAVSSSSPQAPAPATCAAPAAARPAASASELLAELEQLKRDRDAVILAHYYVAPEIQAVADYVGDSFALAKLAVSLPQQTLVIAGVAFMGESMKLLNPGKTVLLPNPHADCPMAHMVSRGMIDALRAVYGDDLAVVCYVNSTAAIKSWSDVCVTSSNAVKIVRALPQRHILFIPDQNLGGYVAAQVPEKNVILNDGCCPHHQAVTSDEVAALKAAHPGALVLAHPECTDLVLKQADYVGSTAGIISFAEQSDAREFIVVTMRGVEAELEKRCNGVVLAGEKSAPAGEKSAPAPADAAVATPRKRFYFVEHSTCPDMASITLDQVLACLRDPAPEQQVSVPGEFTEPAKRMLDRMLDLAGK